MSFICASDPPCDGKLSWPELLGVLQDQAIAAIHQYNPDISVLVLPPGGLPRGDYCCNRVYLYVDHLGGIVIQEPKIG